jgi:hypothetical protein
MAGVAIEANDLHIVTDDEARALFRDLLGLGEKWKSELMQYVSVRWTAPDRHLDARA